MTARLVSAPLCRDVPTPWAVDLRASLGALHRGRLDPALRFDGPDVWRAMRTPTGPATMHLQVRPRDAVVRATAWGRGAPWALKAAAELLGVADSRDGWEPTHALLRQLDAHLPGLRLPRTGLVLEALVPAVLEQKVSGEEARRSWAELLWRHGEPAPGPVPTINGIPRRLRVPPAAEVLAALPSWEWHRAGVERRRAEFIAAAAHRARRVEECVTLGRDDAARRLRALPGVGVWTAAEVAQRAFGDPDAVSVGDYHLPSVVGWALVGEPLDDAGMLEVLEPYAGHRYRAIRLIELSGLRPPRHGPRARLRALRSI
ncbi:MAG: DNA-3-methyladenine glycosylase [Mycobacteriales bacterium]|nr:hypothetical protein [Frankia sp.]